MHVSCDVYDVISHHRHHLSEKNKEYQTEKSDEKEYDEKENILFTDYLGFFSLLSFFRMILSEYRGLAAETENGYQWVLF